MVIHTTHPFLCCYVGTPEQISEVQPGRFLWVVGRSAVSYGYTRTDSRSTAWGLLCGWWGGRVCRTGTPEQMPEVQPGFFLWVVRCTFRHSSIIDSFLTESAADSMDAAQCTAQLTGKANEIQEMVQTTLLQVTQALSKASSQRAAVSRTITGAQTTAQQLNWFFGAKLALCRSGALPAHVDISYNTNNTTKDDHGVSLDGALVFVVRGAFSDYPNTVLYLIAPGTDGRKDMRTLTAIAKATESRVSTSKKNTSEYLDLLVLARVCAETVTAELEASPPFESCTQALKNGAPAVVWSAQGVTTLSEKPILPTQMTAAFQLEVSQYELKLLACNPSCYCLEAREGEQDPTWENLPEFARAAAELSPNVVVKGAVVVYYE